MRNPIHPIISDELFNTLIQLNLLNKKKIRDFEIKRYYLYLRECGARAGDAIDQILDYYPHLQHDTIRKIVYSVKLPDEVAHTEESLILKKPRF
jgi:hypothetical protein